MLNHSVGIMQPYFLPYIGYFQLLNAVDEFVVYDNIQYTKKGWINRNRFLQNSKDALFSLPLKKDSDHRRISERQIADSFNPEKLLKQLENAYRKAPLFKDVFPLLKTVALYKNRNLFTFLHHSLIQVNAYLDITTPIRVSSTIPIDHQLKSQEKVIALSLSANAETYINAIGGIDLYSKPTFENHDIQLKFLKTSHIKYQQFNNEFVPALSIIDVMMFNSQERIQSELLTDYELI